MSAKKSKIVTLADLKEHISCHLCEGYLKEATTIIECLHTFCKECIVKYLNDGNKSCPKCDNIIHQSHPLNYISFDRTMQDIVYKLVPHLEVNKKDSDTNNNLSGSVQSNENRDKDNGNKLKPIDINGQARQGKNNAAFNDYHRGDEQINIYLIPHPSCELKPLKNKYIRLSSLATVTHLKKYIAVKLYNEIERYKELDLLCNDNLLGKDHNLKFVSVTEWREKVPPVKITYRPRSDD